MEKITFIAERLGRQPPRRVHGKKRVRAQILSFRASRSNHGTPIVLRDTTALLPFADSPMALTNVSGQFRDGLAALKNVVKGLHVPNSAGDELSRQGLCIIPVTETHHKRTIRPMGRGTTPTRFKKEFAARLR